ncbi:hypothetical protein ACWCXX_24910 [Streptomyces sp. NPDC001732]
MDTTAAAAAANVTVATVRGWCRAGVVAAAKTAGRWVVDAASLARCVEIGARRTGRRARTVVLTAELLVAIGGRRWQKNGMDRVYLNDWEQYTGIDVSRYGTGNICGATLDGRDIANGRATRALDAIEKVWFDTADGRLHARHYGADAHEIRFLDGTRTTVDLVARVFSGIKVAVAAL